MKKKVKFNRRQFISRTASLATGLAATATALGAGLILPGNASASSKVALIHTPLLKVIPSTGEKIPVIGMGTSRTFDAIGDDELLAELEQVTRTFFDMGGGMIDSSPMYGSSQQVIGKLLARINGEKNLFAATKVWVEGREEGIKQMERSRKLWGIKRFDLMQIHNLIDWQTHLETLQQMKADGEIRYIGITTSHGRYHDRLKDILKKHAFDFVQLSYNIGNRTVEAELLPIAQDRGIAVIVNRPFQRGELFARVRGKPLPSWTHEFDCNSWGQFFLKYAVSHPAVSCAIPATTKVKHMIDNMMAGKGRLPTEKQRAQMLEYYESL
jgi:diketogulonate reductase-like aldo/keto reductase